MLVIEIMLSMSIIIVFDPKARNVSRFEWEKL